MTDPRLDFVLNELVLPTGKRVGESLERDPWVIDKFLSPIFETTSKGLPRYALCFLELGRGHWKSGGLAGVALAEAVLFPGTDVVIVAADVDQARIDLDALDGYTRANPTLAALVQSKERGNSREVEGGSRIRVISADVPGAWGLGGTHHRFRVVCEELSEWRDERLWAALSSATGKTKDAQTIIVSNAGYDKDRSWQWRVRETARTKRWAYLFSAPGPIASWIDERWVEQQRALLPPVAFDRVILNQWTAQSGDYITRDAWRRIVEPGLRPSSTGSVGAYFGGLDLGLTKDRTAFAICHLDGQRVVLDLLEVWEGTASDPVSILAVETFVEDAYRRFPGLRLVADPWQAEGSVQKLTRAGRRIEKFTFSPKSIHGLSTTLYSCVQDETLRVYDDRELENEVLSLQVRETPEGWRFDHRRGGYSDRVVALAMALQAAVKTRTATQPLRLSQGWKARAEGDRRREVLARGLTFRNPGEGLQPPRAGNSDWQQYFRR